MRHDDVSVGRSDSASFPAGKLVVLVLVEKMSPSEEGLR